MKKYYFLIIVALILGLVLTGCSLLSNVGQVPTSPQSGISYLTKGGVPPPSSVDLVGLWHFDDNANDSSGNGLDGDVTGIAKYTDGKFDKALSFDGTNNYVKVVDQVDLDVTDYTIELWINANDFSKMYPTLLNRRVQTPTVGYYWIWIKDNCIVLTYSDGTIARSAYWYTSFSTGEWYHIALTKSGSLFTMYKNASSLGIKNLTYVDTVDGDLFIGTYQGRTASRYNFNGIIDEVRIWDGALTGSNIEYNYSLRKIGIDIKPGSDINSINLGSHGVVPVAILGSIDFDAATVDPLTVTLSGAEVKVKGHSGNAGSLEDVNDDGYTDLLVQVYTENLDLTIGEINAVLNAYTYAGPALTGSDSIRIVPPE